ncbi:alcohol dehydrogenase catalytic domain-containing protein [Tropicibacter oceani]|uniref:Zinc-binding dehydrogenase n=1 Tax=Tropicibacter oceani TaxID=3058420 RepID=A0ABY8QMX1_9RHOB|nr:zinc-binding dehydrogenase [Tropicibacter oceani]WGW05985.1 zinc-binding dehydrogenase [Tropicibacter oceani]
MPGSGIAVILTGHGGLDKLEWREDVAVPRPTAGEVLIRVGASAVNNTDVNTRTGWYSKAVRGDTGSAAAEGYGGASDADGGWSGALSFPRIQGADCCAQIVAVAEGADRGRIGQRVLVRPMHRPSDSDDPDALVTFGSERDGVFADLVRYIEVGEIRPVLAKSFPLRELRAAQETFLDKSHMGKIGIEI